MLDDIIVIEVELTFVFGLVLTSFQVCCQFCDYGCSRPNYLSGMGHTSHLVGVRYLASHCWLLLPSNWNRSSYDERAIGIEW